MNYGNVLPVTGGGISLFGAYILGVSDLVLVGIGLVLAGIITYRIGSRRRAKRVSA